MGADRETKEKLTASAKTEFMEKGYAGASLRKICADAGVTTGALYFFFRDKEDLFRSIVDPPLRELMDIMQTHFAEDTQLLSGSDAYTHTAGDHEQLVQLLIHHLYANRDAFLLLLTKSQGTAFENCVDEIVEMMEQGYRAMAEQISEQTPGKHISSYMLHWMAHMNIDAFIHLLTHETDEGKALRYMGRIMDYLVRGWLELILSPETE
ncbi:MAG: TetR/AcrR family transcriptional regulator [Porcipelethomonas sp.]